MTATTARNAQTAALEALIEAHAVELKLPTVRRRFRALAQEATREQQTPTAYLAALLEAEMAERAERRERRRLIDARFPQIKRLEDFSFTDNPTVPQATIAALAAGSWISDRETVIFIGDSGPGSHCPPRVHRWANSPRSPPDTLILSPFRRPWVTWMAVSSPRWTLCKTVWRATPSALAAWSSGRYPSGTSGTNLARVSGSRRMRQAAPGVVCWPASRPSLSQR
jgi:hypothetical protein